MAFVLGDTLIVATRNAGKVKEFAHAFAAFGTEVQSMYDFPDLPDVVEDGATFEENAFKKAKEVAEALVASGLQPVWKDWDSWLGRASQSS